MKLLIKYIAIVCFLSLSLYGCGSETTGIDGNDNDGNRVAVGDGNTLGDDNRTYNDNSTRIEAPDDTPPDLEEDIAPITFSSDSYEAAGSGCGDAMEDILFVSEYFDRTSDIGTPVVLQDDRDIRQNFYLGGTIVSQAQKSWFPYIFVPGRKVSVQYYECGNAPIRNLTYIEALRSE